MKRQSIAAVTAGLLALPTTALAESRTLEVPTFHGVDASAGIHVVASGGKPASVVADASNPQDLSDLRFEVRDGVLTLWYDWSIGQIFDWSKRNVTVTIGSELLDSLEAAAGASIEADGLMGEDIDLEASSGASIRTGAIEGMFYSIESSSGARIETSGFCTSATIEVSSGASVAAKALDCDKVELEVSSGASLEITARQSVDAEVSSGGHAAVYGRPSVDHLETGSGGSVDFPG